MNAALSWGLGLACFGFLANFWATPWGVLALKRLAGGEIQVDTRPYYRPEDLRRLLEKYGPEGRRLFRNMLYVDMAFPAFYAAFLSTLALGADGSVLLTRIAVSISILAALLDYGENLCLFKILATWPAFDIGLARRAAGFTAAKGVAILLSVALVVVFRV